MSARIFRMLALLIGILTAVAGAWFLLDSGMNAWIAFPQFTVSGLMLWYAVRQRHEEQ